MGKVLVSGQIVYICLMGSLLSKIPCRLLVLIQMVKLKKYGDVYHELIKIKRCCGLRAGVLVMLCFCINV